MSKIIMTLIPVQGEKQTSEFDWPKEPGYDRIKKAMSQIFPGAHPEHVSFLSLDGEPLDMFVDDEGAIKNLPRNEEATMLYRHNWLSQYPNHPAESLSAIYGPAVIFSRRVWF